MPWVHDSGFGHHSASHWTQDGSHMRPAFQAMCKWVTDEVGDFLVRMDSVPEAEGKTLLDNSLVYFNSETADGGTHARDRYPVILGGTVGGKIRTGAHERTRDSGGGNLSVNKLFVSIVRTMGVSIQRFGDDGDGPFPDLS